MITITNLRKRLSDTFTLEIPSLCVADGERVALIGPNGSGKSTLLRLISGALRPDSGSIEITAPSGAVGYQPQSPYVFKGTVEANVRLGVHGGTDPSDLMRQCGLAPLRAQKASLLSGGERQRLCLCRMLAGNYRLLLLDEPLSAADIETGDMLTDVLTTYCAKNETTLLFATHLPKQAYRAATKILIMHHGAITDYGKREEMDPPKSEFGKQFLSQWVWE